MVTQRNFGRGYTGNGALLLMGVRAGEFGADQTAEWVPVPNLVRVTNPRMRVEYDVSAPWDDYTTLDIGRVDSRGMGMVFLYDPHLWPHSARFGLVRAFERREERKWRLYSKRISATHVVLWEFPAKISRLLRNLNGNAATMLEMTLAVTGPVVESQPEGSDSARLYSPGSAEFRVNLETGKLLDASPVSEPDEGVID